MANIDISDLRPAGADLFLDSESYLNDLTEGEMIVQGRRGWISLAWTDLSWRWDSRYGYCGVGSRVPNCSVNCVVTPEW